MQRVEMIRCIVTALICIAKGKPQPKHKDMIKANQKMLIRIAHSNDRIDFKKQNTIHVHDQK